MSMPYRFHAAEVSLFSAKVRPALRYKRLWYEELRADAAEIQRRVGTVFIPIVITPEDETWQDTSEILDRLEERYPDPPLYPNTAVQGVISSLVELYADEFLITPAMQSRWGTPERVEWARARLSAQFQNPMVGNMAADAMIKRRDEIGVTPESGPAIEAHTRDLLDALSAHFEAQPYLLGERMSLGDCSLMGPIHGHFFTDMMSRQQLLTTALPVATWVDRCNIPNTDQQGEWLADDAVSPTLSEAISVMGRDAAPAILDWIGDIERWLDDPANHDGPLPREIGITHTRLRDVPFPRMTLPYSLWMLQRPLDAYRALAADERKRVDQVLAGSGWEPLLAYQPRHRVAKSGFELVVA